MARLGYGLRELPERVTSAWGARWIWPNDLVYDRQDWLGPPEAGLELQDWLNNGPLREARDRAAQMAQQYELRQTDDQTVTLFEDERGIIRANPQNSSGYLYVAAWLKSSTT